MSLGRIWRRHDWVPFHPALNTTLALRWGCYLHVRLILPCFISYFSKQSSFTYLRIAFCACYAMNTWHTQNFPFLTQLLYYENGTEYNQLSILNDDFTLNNDKLAVQGLPWYAASQLLFKVSRTMYIGGQQRTSLLNTRGFVVGY